MGARQISVATNALQTAVIVTTAETVVITSPPVSLTFDQGTLLIFWQVALTTGSSTTALAFILRRGTTTGFPQVGQTWRIPVVASAAQFYTGCYLDQPGVVAGQQYSITVTQTGATGNGSVQDGCITILNP